MEVVDKIKKPSIYKGYPYLIGGAEGN